jgi:hypothetical protein
VILSLIPNRTCTLRILIFHTIADSARNDTRFWPSGQLGILSRIGAYFLLIVRVDVVQQGFALGAYLYVKSRISCSNMCKSLFCCRAKTVFSQNHDYFCEPSIWAAFDRNISDRRGSILPNPLTRLTTSSASGARSSLSLSSQCQIRFLRPSHFDSRKGRRFCSTVSHSSTRWNGTRSGSPKGPRTLSRTGNRTTGTE